MKMRADFVTNSSSYSSVVIRIESQQLAGLLANYRQLFEDISLVDIDSEELFIADSDEDKVPDGWDNVPKSLEQLLDRLLGILDGTLLPQMRTSPQAQQMKREIQDNRQQLTDSIQKVEWIFQDDREDQPEDTVWCKRFTYDREEGGSGQYQQQS